MAAGEQHAIFTDNGIQTVIHLIDEVHGVGHSRCSFNLLTAVLFVTGIGDIIGHRVVEEMHILRDQSNLVTQRPQGVLAQIVTINQDLSLIDVVEASDQAGNGRFTGARAAHQRDGLACRDFQIDVTKRWRITTRVGKGHVAEFYITG